MTAPRAADPVNTVTPPQAVFKDSMQSLDNKSQDGLSNLRRGKDILKPGLCPIIKIKTLPPWSTDNNYLWHLQINYLHCFFGNSCEALIAPWFSIAWSEDSQKVWVPEEDTNLGGSGGERPSALTAHQMVKVSPPRPGLHSPKSCKWWQSSFHR